MAHNQDLANRIQAALELYEENFTPKKMFGGITYLYKGKMTVGAINEDLMVRVTTSKMDAVLDMEHVRPMDFTGKPMKEFVFVASKGFESEAQLNSWIELGLEHAKLKLGE